MSLETDRIEADLNQSRHRLNDTLEALGQKLSPGQMVDEVLGLAQGQAGEFASKLGRQVKDNPPPRTGVTIAPIAQSRMRAGRRRAIPVRAIPTMKIACITLMSKPSI